MDDDDSTEAMPWPHRALRKIGCTYDRDIRLLQDAEKLLEALREAAAEVGKHHESYHHETPTAMRTRWADLIKRIEEGP